MTHEPQWYQSPIHIPEKTSGKASIHHRILPAGSTTPIVGFRQAILRGMRPVNAVLKKPLVVHELIHQDHGVWMTDLPEELNQIAEMLGTIQPKGNILVGGLGLGILALAVSQLVDVESVTVVEIDPDIIKLCAQPGYDYEVVNQDLNEFLKTSTRKFDCYILDTWQGTNEGTWWSEVFPLRRAIRNRFGKTPVIHCWAEDIMQGQVLRTLTGSQSHWYYKDLPMPMSMKLARSFLREIGLPAWEQKYGKIIDRNMKEKSS